MSGRDTSDEAIGPISGSQILGCVLAGGQSVRFGSDKALAQVGGRSLLDLAADYLSPRCARVVAAGRQDAGVEGVADWPEPGLGPLGGLAGALRQARADGLAAVLSIGVDSIGLPEDILGRLSPGPACLAAQPVVGLWPVSALPVLEAILTGDERRSVLHFAERIGARLVEIGEPPANINTPADLARHNKQGGA